MSNRVRRIFAVACAALLLSATVSTTASSQTLAQADSANAPAVVDALLLRPAGFLSLIVGTGIFLLITPIVLITRPHEIGTPFKTLIGRPAKYLWMDPIGGH